MKEMFSIFLIIVFMSNGKATAQEQNLKGFHIVIHAMNGHVINENEIEYFEWAKKEIKLKRDACIGCLHKEVFNFGKLIDDIYDENPHFSFYIDSVKIFDGYFPALGIKWPDSLPILFMNEKEEGYLEIIKDGKLIFCPYKSIEEINSTYDPMIKYHAERKKPSDRFDKEESYKRNKANEYKRLEILNGKRLYEYLKSKNLLKD